MDIKCKLEQPADILQYSHTHICTKRQKHQNRTLRLIETEKEHERRMRGLNLYFN